MKKLIAFIPTYLLFYISHLISKTFLINKLIGYKLYNWCMITSSNIQDWADLSKPWNKVN